MGAFVLARSLWGRPPPSWPGSLRPPPRRRGLRGPGRFGDVGWGAAAVPWILWGLRKGLRGEGTRFVVTTGLVSALAVLHQPECAYALAVLCLAMLAVELGRVRSGGTQSTPVQVVG